MIVVLATGSRADVCYKAPLEGWMAKHFPDYVIDENCWHKSTAQQRAARLVEYLLNPDVDIIWSLRGGEGSADLLPFLEAHKGQISVPITKKMLGFSDFTVLLNYFSQKFGVTTWRP